jgi:(acyl-carrier-protein) S-malonyltransferase
VQICSPVKWYRSIEHIIEDHRITHVVEFGYGGILTRMMKKINDSIECLHIDEMENL